MSAGVGDGNKKGTFGRLNEGDDNFMGVGRKAISPRSIS